jgi:hypothetical protein
MRHATCDMRLESEALPALSLRSSLDLYARDSSPDRRHSSGAQARLAGTERPQKSDCRKRQNDFEITVVGLLDAFSFPILSTSLSVSSLLRPIDDRPIPARFASIAPSLFCCSVISSNRSRINEELRSVEMDALQEGRALGPSIHAA